MTANEISQHLQHFVWQPNNIVLPNFYYNKFEMDLFRLLPSGYIYEYEIKISKSDFKQDFMKSNYHSGYYNKKHDLIKSGKLANKFFFVCPENLIEIDEIPDYAGLIYNGNKIIKPAKLIHKNLYPENRYRDLAILLAFRENNLRYKLKYLTRRKN
jgi:hypothetical protein